MIGGGGTRGGGGNLANCAYLWKHSGYSFALMIDLLSVVVISDPENKKNYILDVKMAISQNKP